MRDHLVPRLYVRNGAVVRVGPSVQQRFMALMGEKADLLDQLQEQENTVVRLSGETETIGKCGHSCSISFDSIYSISHLSAVQESTSRCTSCSERPSEKSSMRRIGSSSS